MTGENVHYKDIITLELLLRFDGDNTTLMIIMDLSTEHCTALLPITIRVLKSAS